MLGLTQRQREIADFIESFCANHGLSPTYREIQKHFNFSSLGTVYSQIKTLKRKGVLQGKGARTLTLVQEPSREKELPLVGKLIGGMPLQMFSSISPLSIPLYLIPNQECYLVRAEGNSLFEELIMDGDLLLIEPRADFEDGELALALIDGMTSLVKKIYKDPPYIRFESVNPEVQPLILREDHVEVQGIISSLLRNYFSS